MKWNLMEGGCSEQNKKQEQSQDFRYDCENFTGIAKISLGLRKFRNHSENMAILAKLRIFARLAKFR